MVVELTENETDTVTDPELDQIGDEEIEAWCSWLDRYRAIIKVRSCVSVCGAECVRVLVCVRVTA